MRIWGNGGNRGNSGVISSKSPISSKSSNGTIREDNCNALVLKASLIGFDSFDISISPIGSNIVAKDCVAVDQVQFGIVLRHENIKLWQLPFLF
jgi:hypothetical protein